MTPSEAGDIAARHRQVLGVPLIEFLEAVPENPADPVAGLRLTITDKALNAAGVLHGGVMATALDLAAYLAILPQLDPSEEAVTHAFAASYLNSGLPREALLGRGVVLRRTRRLAFMSAILTSDDRTIATATVTKSIVARHRRRAIPKADESSDANAR